MSSKIRIGAIGLGFISQTVHLPNLVSCGSFELVAVCDKRLDLLDKVADKYGVVLRYTSFERMLTEAQLDAVVVVVQRSMTFRIVSVCLAHHVFVLTEKPLLLNSKSVSESFVTGLTGGGLFIGYMKRYSEAVNYVRSFVRDKHLLAVHASCGMGDSYEGISGDIKSDLLRASKPEEQEVLPEFESGIDPYYYEQYLNVFSHTIDISEYLTEKTIKLTEANLDPSGQGQVYGELGTTPYCLTTMRRKNGPWYERVEIFTSDHILALAFPAAMSRRTGATVEIWGEDGEYKLTTFSETGVENFKRQYQSFAAFVEGTSERGRFSDLHSALRHASLVETCFRKNRQIKGL